MDMMSALRAFVRTVERGSVTAAAHDLSISQPAVSKHLANLERHMRARLLERSARLVRPTPEGLRLYESSRAALASIEAAVEGVRSTVGVVEGTIRVHAPSCIGAKVLHPVVMDFQRRNPAVAVELLLENRSVDLVYENIDIALRYGVPEAQDVIIRRLGFVQRILVASPAFLARSGAVDKPERLSAIDLVTTTAIVSQRNVLTLQNGRQSVDIVTRPLLKTNDAYAITATLLAGHAAGPVQALLVAEHLKSGALVRILPDYEVKPTEAFLAYPSVRFMRPAVRAFADFVVERMAGVAGFSVA